jgi:hypothetical protein
MSNSLPAATNPVKHTPAENTAARVEKDPKNKGRKVDGKFTQKELKKTLDGMDKNSVDYKRLDAVNQNFGNLDNIEGGYDGWLPSLDGKVSVKDIQEGLKEGVLSGDQWKPKPSERG